LLEDWKELIIVPIYKKMIKQNVVFIEACNLLVLYNILSNIMLSRLTPCAEEIIGLSAWISLQWVSY